MQKRHLKKSRGVVKDPVCLQKASLGIVEKLDASIIPESERFIEFYQPYDWSGGKGNWFGFSGQAEMEIGLVCIGGHQSVSCGCWFHFVALSSPSLIYISVPPLIFSSYKQT